MYIHIKRWHIYNRQNLLIIIANIISLLIFFIITAEVLNQKSIVVLDKWINSNVYLLYNTTLTKAMIIMSRIMDPVYLFLLLLILLSFLIYKKKRPHSLLLILSLGAGSLAGSLMKIIIARPRPANALIEATSFSFPSRHAIMSIIFFLFLIYSFKDDIKNKFLRNLFIGVNTVLFLVIGFSRLYLNVHWLSDVMAGFSLGLFILTLLILIFRLITAMIKNVKIKNS